MPEPILRSWKNNKTKLVKESGYKSITEARRLLGIPTDEGAYLYLLAEYNQRAKELNDREKADTAERKKAYEKAKRQSDGNYTSGDYKFLQNNITSSQTKTLGDGSNKINVQKQIYQEDGILFYRYELL